MNLGTKPVTTIASRSSASTVPDSTTDGIFTGKFTRIAMYLDYTGTVNSANVLLWVQDSETGTWFEGAATDSLDALTPGGASAVDEMRVWEVGQNQTVWFQLAAIAGGGSAAIRVSGIAL